MDGVFYWYRIWLSLDKDTRVELDEQQAIVDGAIYTSFILYITGFLLVIYAIIEGLAGIQMAKSLPPGLLLAVSFVAGPAGYIIYRISLPSQRQYGSLFKAMFDLHFKNVDVQPVLEIIAHRTGERWVRAERGPDAYRIAWRCLRWHRFRPRNSDHNINVEKASKVHKTVES